MQIHWSQRSKPECVDDCKIPVPGWNLTVAGEKLVRKTHKAFGVGASDQMFVGRGPKAVAQFLGDPVHAPPGQLHVGETIWR